MPGEHAGTEPRTARSPLRLRLVMSAVMLVLTTGAAVLLAVGATGESGGQRQGMLVASGICVVVAVIALVDLVTVARRLARGDHG